MIIRNIGLAAANQAVNGIPPQQPGNKPSGGGAGCLFFITVIVFIAMAIAYFHSGWHAG